MGNYCMEADKNGNPFISNNLKLNAKFGKIWKSYNHDLGFDSEDEDIDYNDALDYENRFLIKMANFGIRNNCLDEVMTWLDDEVWFGTSDIFYRQDYSAWLDPQNLLELLLEINRRYKKKYKKSLTMLKKHRNYSLFDFPKYFCDIERIDELTVRNAHKIPDCIGKMDIIYLDIGGSYTEVPESIGNLKNLKSLHLIGKYKKLPDSIKKLKNLEQASFSIDSKAEQKRIRKLLPNTRIDF